jgi:hypothetical protein
VQRHVAEDVVEDVRLGEVVQLRFRADDHGRRKPTLSQAFEELPGRNEARHRDRVPPRPRSQSGVHIGEVGHLMRAQPDRLGAVEKHPAAGVAQGSHPPLVQDPPYLVILVRVVAPHLTDERRLLLDVVVVVIVSVRGGLGGRFHRRIRAG